MLRPRATGPGLPPGLDQVPDTGCMDLPVMPPVAPMLAKPVTELPEGPFSFEPKWDGFRTVVFRDGDEVELGSRNERPLTRYFPELVEAVKANLPQRCVLDGEIVVRDPAGRWLARFEGAGLDGIVAKRLDGVYEPDRRVWRKVKHARTADCVVGGYRLHKSAPDAIGSLLLGLFTDAGELPASGWSARSRWRAAGSCSRSCSRW